MIARECGFGGRVILPPWSELSRGSSTDLDHPDCSTLVAQPQLGQVVDVEEEDDGGGECEDGEKWEDPIRLPALPVPPEQPLGASWPGPSGTPDCQTFSHSYI